MNNTIPHQAMALAGVFQVTYLVKQIAWEGRCDQEAVLCSLKTIYQLEADSFDTIFGDISGLRHGLSTLRTQLAGTAQLRDIEISRYTATLLHLESKLKSNQRMLDQIGAEINQAQGHLEMFDIEHENTIARLANIYTQTISTLSPRVLINGDHTHLNDQKNANKIRALLLAGIRAAVLWRQCGGSRWKLITRRTKYVKVADQLLNDIGTRY